MEILVSTLLLGLLPATLIAAAVYDLTSFTIPNKLQLILLAGFAAFAASANFTLPMVAWHLAAGFIGFGLGLALFGFGFVGGGDAKLFAILLLWLGPKDLVSYAIVTAIFGGLVTMLFVTLRRIPLSVPLLGQPWLLRLHDSRAGIPYGVALAGGIFAILPHSEIFRIASQIQ